MESPRRWSNEMKKQPHTVIFLSFLGMSSRQVLISAGAFSKQLWRRNFETAFDVYT